MVRFVVRLTEALHVRLSFTCESRRILVPCLITMVTVPLAAAHACAAVTLAGRASLLVNVVLTVFLDRFLCLDAMLRPLGANRGTATRVLDSAVVPARSVITTRRVWTPTSAPVGTTTHDVAGGLIVHTLRVPR